MFASDTYVLLSRNRIADFSGSPRESLKFTFSINTRYKGGAAVSYDNTGDNIYFSFAEDINASEETGAFVVGVVHDIAAVSSYSAYKFYAQGPYSGL